MKVTLIKPNIGRKGDSLYVDHGRMEPLMLGVIAALTPSDVDVELLDDRIEQVPSDDATDLVGITVETYTARRAYEIADDYRSRGVPVVLGGMHVTLAPEEAALHADSIFLGDAELLWHQVITDARTGNLKKLYHAAPGVAQVNRLVPRRDLFANKGYLPITLMQFSRGCRFGCSFCAVSRYFDHKHYVRQVDEVIAEIEAQKNRLIFFVDDNIASDPRMLKDLCRELIPLKVRWLSQASLDVTNDETLMSLMTQSGCLGHVMGFESINPASLKEARKAPNIPGFTNYEKEIKVLRDYGLQTWAAFTLGYDHDTRESIQATLDFALHNRFTFAAFNILMPYPGTPLHNQLQKESRLLYDGAWWLHPEYRFNEAAFQPANMSPDELTTLCHDARVQFNSLPAILRRFSDVKTNLSTIWRAAAFWRYAFLFRTELHKKHHMRFGAR